MSEKLLLKGGWLVDPSQGLDGPLDLLIRDHGVQMRSFPDDVVSRMAEAAWDVRAASGRDGIEKRIYDSFEASLKLMRGWADVSEGPYYAARNANK